MADRNTKSIVSAFIEIVSTAKNIYKNENLTDIRIYVDGNYVIVDALTVNREHYEEWESIYLDNKEEVEIAHKLIRRIKFPNERVYLEDDGIHVSIRNSPKLDRIREAINSLRNASWVSEFHEEDNGYSLITRDTGALKKFYNEFRDVVEIHLEDGIYEIYF